MIPSILLIDDEPLVVQTLKKYLTKQRPQYLIDTASSEAEINEKIENSYFHIVVTDLKMDNFTIDGFDIIEKIADVHPLVSIIVMTGFETSYQTKLAEVIKLKKVERIINKGQDYEQKILEAIEDVLLQLQQTALITRKNLEYYYSEAKNEKDNYQKGIKFERFVSTLFQMMGFQHIQQRVIDKSRNETDLIIRNEVNDLFFQKFSPYFLVECKNTIDKIDKNQFIVFATKLEHTNNMANLGFIITSSTIKSTTVAEEIRTSSKGFKIIFIAQKEIEQLIVASNLLEELKKIIDRQVKNN